MILFGIRSPLVVEYEETCHRLGLSITAAVSVNGVPRMMDRSVIVDLAHFNPLETADHFIACAFTPARRAALIAMAQQLGLILSPALIDPTAVLARAVRIGAGSFVNAGAVIGAVSIIGEGVLINRSVSLGHHTVLGDHVSIGPGATLAGNIHVGAGAMIGVGAIVLPDIRIGAGALIAAGSLVRRHVPEGAFVAGNPAQERPFDAAKSSLYLEDGE
jgi:sugar O-acyltransferase (sialic acid O-acetyltransferase NeuD family)